MSKKVIMYVDDYHVTFTKDHENGLVSLLQLLNVESSKELTINPLFAIKRLIKAFEPSNMFMNHDFGFRSAIDHETVGVGPLWREAIKK